jgi:hypothetical protein
MSKALCILAVVLLAMFARAEIVLPANPRPSQQFAAEELQKYAGNPQQSIPVTTLADAYQMLENAGVRFLAPQFDFYHGAAEFAPKELILQPAHRPEPKLKFRKLYVEEGHSHTSDNLKQLIEWMPKAGYNTLVVPMDYQGRGRVKWDNWREVLTPELQKRDVTIEVGGHGYQNFLNPTMEDGKLFEQHPEWFGQDRTGKRRREKNFIFCTSNPQAVDYLIGNLIEYVNARREIQIFDLWPPDAGMWCQCDACAKLGSPSQRQAILVSQVKERVRAARPDLRLEVLAYLTSITPPEQETLDKDVLLDFCPISQQFDFQIDDPAAPKNAQYVAGLKAWREHFDGEISIYSYYRKYAWDSLPVLIPHYMQKDLQFYARLPVQGVSSYSEPRDWATYELNHYVLAKLACDPDADVDALMKQFCDARYGAASEKVLATMRTLEETMRAVGGLPNVSLKGSDEVAHASHEIELARASLEGISNDAIARLRLMLDYALRDLEIQKMRADHAESDAIREKIEAMHEFLAAHENDGVFLVQRITLPRMLSRYEIK